MTVTTERSIASEPPEPDRPAMSHREVLEAMSGLLLAMFVAILSSTVVSTALPRIIGDLGGSQSSYTWVVTSTLLALTVTTPIWGKLSDLFDRKLLVQTGLVLYVASTFIGRLVSRTGRYKRFLLTGAVLLTVGLGLMGTLDETTSLVELGVFMFVMGAGAGIDAGGTADQVPDVSTLPAPVAHIIEHAYGTGVGEIFLTAAPLGLIALAAVALMREVPLGGKSGIDIAREWASTNHHQGATS